MIHIVFIIAIFITIIGWFFDRAKSFDWLMVKIARNYVVAKESLEILKNNSKNALAKEDEGVPILLNNWPNLKDKTLVEYIGRTPAFVSFGSQVKNDIGLVLYDKNQKEIQNRWSVSEAECMLEKTIESKLFKIGACLFWGGIIASIISHIVSIKTNS